MERFKLQHADKLKKAESDSKCRAMYLANVLPVSILTDVQRRLKPTALTEVTYEKLEAQLKISFGIKKSLIGASVNFLTCKQKVGQNIESYAKTLNELASHCDYKSCCLNRLVRDAFVSGLLSKKLISLLITDCETQTFEECVEKAKTMEQMLQDVSEINPSSKSLDFQNSIDSVKPKRYEHKSKEIARPDKKYKCIRCNSIGKHFVNKCYAIKLKCHSCQKTGHIARACRARKNSPYKNTNYMRVEELDSSDYIAIRTLYEDYSDSPYYSSEEYAEQTTTRATAAAPRPRATTETTIATPHQRHATRTTGAPRQRVTTSATPTTSTTPTTTPPRQRSTARAGATTPPPPPPQHTSSRVFNSTRNVHHFKVDVPGGNYSKGNNSFLG